MCETLPVLFVAAILLVCVAHANVAWVFESKEYAAAVRAQASGWEVQQCGSSHDCTSADKLVQSIDYFYPDFKPIPTHVAVANFQSDWHVYGSGPIAGKRCCVSMTRFMAEFCVASIFDFIYSLRLRSDQFKRCAWSAAAPSSCAESSTQSTHKTFRQFTVGIVGYGNIGQEVAQRVAAMGATVVASKPSGPFDPPPAPLKWLSPDNDRVYREADVVVVTVPGALVGLVNKTALSMMKAGALLIPTSAGPINYPDLLEALTANPTDLFAYVDEWPAGCWHYPNTTCGPPYGAACWPGDSTFPSLPNLIATPGLAMRDSLFWQNSSSAVAHNLVSLAAGSPLSYVIRNASRWQQ